MRFGFENIWDFLKIDMRHTFHNSVPFAIAYLCLIPKIRGIFNLDAIQSRDCLLQSVSLVGCVLITPITKWEYDVCNREAVTVKAWDRAKTVGLRLAAAMILTAAVVLGFACVMKRGHCSFDFWEMASETIGGAYGIGLAGWLLGEVGKNLAVGYLGALGCYMLCGML